MQQTMKAAVTKVVVMTLLVACCARAATPDAHFDRIFEGAKSEVDAWTREQVQGVHDVIERVLEEHEAEHRLATALLDEGSGSQTLTRAQTFEDGIHAEGEAGALGQAQLAEEAFVRTLKDAPPLKSESFWKRLFNCRKCELDDGTVGITQESKVVGEAISDAIDAEAAESAMAPDMKIERAYALEWAVFPVPDPLPNPMVSFICDPKENNALFSSKNIEAATKKPVSQDVVDDLTEEIDESRSGEAGVAARQDQKATAVAERIPLMKKIMDKIVAGMAHFGEKCVKALKAIMQILLTATRCAICRS